MVAHFFLWHLHIRLGKKPPCSTVSQLRSRLVVVLPLKTLTIADVLRLVAGIQRRTHHALLSHGKKRMQKLPG